MTMQSFVRNALIGTALFGFGTALFGTAGLVTSTLPAVACDCSNCSARHYLPPPYDPSKGSVGFKKSKKKKDEITMIPSWQGAIRSEP
jgi:hypothetical protein